MFVDCVEGILRYQKLGNGLIELDFLKVPIELCSTGIIEAEWATHLNKI